MSCLTLEWPHPAEAVSPDLASAYLHAYWLRPENAVWMVLRSHALSSAGVARYDLDLGCGDGLFSFIHCGGRLNSAFDVFQAAGSLDKVRSEHADMFDFIGGTYDPMVQCAPHSRIRAGTDLKSALLAKACHLDLYDELIQADHNGALPFADASFDVAYCNTSYWVNNIDRFLDEVRRILVPGGRLILQLKLDTIRTATLRPWQSILGERFLDIIERGRFDTWPTLADRSTWEARFTRAGLTIVDALPVATMSHARLWDVGLRPLAPMLVRMANGLSSSTRESIKAEWCELMLELIGPLCDPNLCMGAGQGEPVELQYELTDGTGINAP